jgi:hypothetical protein
MIRTYSDLRTIESFEERWRYLKLRGRVGESTFGFDRYLNQKFYTSREWRRLRHDVIIRDNGCDLGVDGYEIHNRPTIHHLNPMSAGDIVDGDESILNPEYLITTTHQTHNAIHYGDEKLLAVPFVERFHGDTRLWTRRDPS